MLNYNISLRLNITYFVSRQTPRHSPRTVLATLPENMLLHSRELRLLHKTSLATL